MRLCSLLLASVLGLTESTCYTRTWQPIKRGFVDNDAGYFSPGCKEGWHDGKNNVKKQPKIGGKGVYMPFYADVDGPCTWTSRKYAIGGKGTGFESIDAAFHAVERGDLKQEKKNFVTLSIQFDGKGEWHQMKTVKGNREEGKWIKYDAKAQKTAENHRSFRVRLYMKTSAKEGMQGFDKIDIKGVCPPCAYAAPAWNQCTKDCNTGYQLFTSERTLGKRGCNTQKGERGPTENPKVRLCNTKKCGKKSCADCKWSDMGRFKQIGVYGDKDYYKGHKGRVQVTHRVGHHYSKHKCWVDSGDCQCACQ